MAIVIRVAFFIFAPSSSKLVFPGTGYWDIDSTALAANMARAASVSGGRVDGVDHRIQPELAQHAAGQLAVEGGCIRRRRGSAGHGGASGLLEFDGLRAASSILRGIPSLAIEIEISVSISFVGSSQKDS